MFTVTEARSGFVDLPTDAELLKSVQLRLQRQDPARYVAPPHPRIAGVFVCFGRGGGGPGATGDTGWAAAAVIGDGRCLESATVIGRAGGSYQPGLLALREGPLLAGAVRQLSEAFDCLLVNATGRDHPRRAGLALQLGAHLQIPTVGITTRPLVAEGARPTDTDQGAHAPLMLGGELVGYWLRTRSHCHPLVVHAAWRTDPDTAARIVLAATGQARTPEPLREARRLAREARHHATTIGAPPPPAREQGTGDSGA
jgi:deoxyribonuclease V